RGATPPNDTSGHVVPDATYPATSRCAAARQASGQHAFNSAGPKARGSTGEIGTEPATTRTLHFLQVPCPPQVESTATPFQLAASKSVVPAGTRASFVAPSACSNVSRTRPGPGCSSSSTRCGALTA